ncbi:unnamed protein product [Amaranthus hypochondriacus]
MAKFEVPSKSGSTATVTRLPPPAVKFSNDIERLQFINKIRNSPHAAQLKHVIDKLRERREAFTPEQINEELYVDLYRNKTVFENLKNNPKLRYDGRCFSYKPTHEAKNMDELLVIIQKNRNGMLVIDLEDAYPNVMEDLLADRKVWLLSNSGNSREDIVYSNKVQLPNKVDDDLKQLFRSIELPRDFLDVEKELHKIGVKPLTNTTQRRDAVQIQGPSSEPKSTKKSRQITKRTKLTNAHLPELFQHISS